MHVAALLLHYQIFYCRKINVPTPSINNFHKKNIKPMATYFASTRRQNICINSNDNTLIRLYHHCSGAPQASVYLIQFQLNNNHTETCVVYVHVFNIINNCQGLSWTCNI